MSVPIEQLLVTLVEQELGLSQQQQSTANALAQFNTLLAAINANLTLTRTVLQQVLALQGQLMGVDADLANLISLCQQRGQPVTLPSTPPAGYGGLDASATGAAVWDYEYPPLSGNIMGDQMNDAAYGAQNLGTLSELPFPYAAYISRHFDYSREDASPPLSSPPLPDPTTILPTDADIVAWLNRTVPTYVWTFLNTLPVSYTNTAGGDDWWICNMTEAEFKWWQAGGTANVPLVSPVWPGLANVTLGASQALSDGLLIPGPLDGVIIAITAVPSPISYYPFGPIKSYVHVGGIAFVDDNGQVETVQPIGLDANVVCPKSMSVADHAYLRLQSGVTGTVRPWTKT